jgi:four helix bundle protein
MNSSELQVRLIDFAVLIFELTKTIKKDTAGNTIITQIVRSGTSPALNYGEAIAAESGKDFIHKMQIVLKELRETWVTLNIIKKAKLSINNALLEKVIDECNQLISIFVKSITTSKKKTNIGF